MVPYEKEKLRDRNYRMVGQQIPLVKLGKLLAASHEGKTLGRLLIENEEIDSETLLASLPPDHKERLRKWGLSPEVKISLENLDEWACPFCRSAHGSGRYPSPHLDERNLETNKFYYNPDARRLFVISDTCFRHYPCDIIDISVVDEWLDLSDKELLSSLRLFTKATRLLISSIATEAGKSLGHVQRVLDGNRRSPEIDRKLVAQFRRRLWKAQI